MKTIRSLFIILLSSLFVFGCNSQAVKDPPVFVEMYYQEESATPVKGSTDTAPDLTRLSELTVTTTTTMDITVEAEASIFSETDFEIIIITNGENYDLLYSVELNDSLLGDCVYTDQSTLYKASSTIITETDGSYTTQVALTIPGSENHTTYLSDRTISLTKILFTRDTADGTFPADIPSNTTTSLLFEVQAIRYFDAVLGVPLEVNDGKVDIILTPDSPYYSQAETAAVATLAIPNTVNGYPIGSVILESLDWVTSLELLGATEDVLILGDFSLLSVMTLDTLQFISLTLSEQKALIINGNFPVLTSLTLTHLRGYNAYLSHFTHRDIDIYDAYIIDAGTTPYSFPVLETVVIDDCHLNYLQMGADTYDVSFPGLTDLSITDAILGNVVFGNEDNNFPNLETIALTNVLASSMTFSGTKPEEEAAATISADDLTMDWDFLVKGSCFSQLTFTDCSMGPLRIEGGTIEFSRFSGLTLTNSTFDRNSPRIEIKGSHPDLVNLDLAGFQVPSITIGSVESVFASLTSITLSNLTGNTITIGERDVDFPLLADITLDHVDCTGAIKIGGENADYSVLTTLHVLETDAASLAIGDRGPQMDALELILLDRVGLDTSLTISGAGYEGLDTIVLTDLSAGSLSIMAIEAFYDLYVDNLNLSSIYLNSGSCDQIFVNETAVEDWDYYEELHEDFTIVLGTYVPE